MTKIRRGLAEESKASLKDAVVAQLVERMAELGKTRSGLAREAGIGPRELRYALNEGEGSLTLPVLSKVLEALDLELQVIPKRRK